MMTDFILVRGEPKAQYWSFFDYNPLFPQNLLLCQARLELLKLQNVYN